jgi:hypothetical protein
VRRRPAALAAAAVLLAVLGTGTPAAGAGPDETGWWSRTSIGPLLPVGLPTGVPAGGLFVAGDPDGRSGVSALRFSLAEGELATTLSLAVESTVGVPAVLVCRTAIGWSGQQGGQLSQAPRDACEEGAVEATLSEDRTTLLADVGGLGEPGRLDVLLVPAEPSAFRLVLAPPGEDTLATSPAPVEPGPLPDGSAPAADGGFGDGFTAAPPFDGGFSPGAPLGGATTLPPLDALATGELPGLPDDLVAAAPAPLSAGAPETPRPVAAPALVGGTDRIQVLFALLFAGILLAWWWLLRKEPRAPRSLLALTGGGVSPAPAAGPVRGVGRFARVRSGPAIGV